MEGALRRSGGLALSLTLAVAVTAAILYGAYRAVGHAAHSPRRRLGPGSALGLVATFARVSVALLIALLWTIPLGVAIGIEPPPGRRAAADRAGRRLHSRRRRCFRCCLLALLQLPGGLNLAAILLMLMGTQWYLLFNVIAGALGHSPGPALHHGPAAAVPPDRWRTLILPALLALSDHRGDHRQRRRLERQHRGRACGVRRTRPMRPPGSAALIAQATSAGDYAMLLAATLALVVTVVLLNRLFWSRLYRLAEERYRLE